MMQLLQRLVNLIVKRAYFVLVVPTALNPLLGSSIALAQTPTASVSPEPLLNTQGVLELGDAHCLDEENLCDKYSFQGLAGQRITILLESDEFDTWLQIIDSKGREVVKNDNVSEENSNSFVNVTLPLSDDYSILVNASSPEVMGNYTLQVIPSQHDFLSPLIELLEVGREITGTSEEMLGMNDPLPANAFIMILSVMSEIISGTQENSQQYESYEYEDVGLSTAKSLGQSIDHLLSLHRKFSNPNDGTNSSVTTAQLQQFLAELYVFLLNGTVDTYVVSHEVRHRETSGFWAWFAGNPVPEESKELSDLLMLYFNVLWVFGDPQEWGFETNLSQYVEEVEELESLAGNLTTGLALEQIGDYFGALLIYQQELETVRSQEHGDQVREVESLLRIGSLYNTLGLYPSAIDSLNQSLTTLNTINLIDRVDKIAQNYYEKRTELSEPNLPNSGERIIQLAKIAAKFRQLDLKAAILINLGSTYNHMGQQTLALTSYEQALTIYQEIGNPAGTAAALNGIGSVYNKLGQSEEALEQYHPALRLRRQIGNRVGESETLSRIGKILAANGQTELAIIFYKQSINITELIRQDLLTLPQYQQEYYTRAITDTYRQLADLLLQQNRVLEAQQVLDLLKVQELDDYLHNVRGNEQTAQGLDFWQPEQRLLQLYEQSPNFGGFLSNPEVLTLIEQLRHSAQGQSLNPQVLINLQDNLQGLPNAALLYPLVLDDRLELILITPSGEPIRRTVAVQREDLNRAIAEFRALLMLPNNDAIPKAQQLYQWLIQPVAADLEQAGIETILHAADGQLRYVPLAALHDGNQWLIQQFTINYITAASLTDFSQEPESQLQVLAGAFSDTEKEHSFQVGDLPFRFTGLEYAGIEVENIAAEIPTTAPLFDDQFSRANVEPRMDDYTIIHFATHAAFVPGLPEESFILFGNGDRVTLRDIATWSLPNVDLVVLSACETAVGGKLGNGEEILGFGYQIQEARARAAIASLWAVNDGGTQVLMNAFYAALKQTGITKAEALRRAQTALITGNFTELGLEISPEQVQQLNYPYYWAPFILIGNGL